MDWSDGFVAFLQKGTYLVLHFVGLNMNIFTVLFFLQTLGRGEKTELTLISNLI